MVRLLLATRTNAFCHLTVFQSHNGAIAARFMSTARRGKFAFQSHNGAIAAVGVGGGRCAHECFNPTMVRLLLRASFRRKGATCRFQSHNGAIAASDLPASGDSVNNVSIPQWCDCCWMRGVRM